MWKGISRQRTGCVQWMTNSEIMVSVMTSVLSNGWKAEKEWWIVRLEGQLAFVTPVWPLPCFLLVFLENRKLIWTGESLVLPEESQAWFPIIWNYLTANFSERMVGEHESSEESLEKPRLRQADLRSLCMCKGVIVMLVSERIGVGGCWICWVC